jgi:hypothetical protein
MKPIPQANYPIKVFTHTAENEGSDLYDGIYGLRLNYSIRVCLCPRYDTMAYGFPPDPALLNALHPMGEEIVTVDAARAFTLTAGPLVLLEQEAQAGQLLQRAYTVSDFLDPAEALPGLNYDEQYTVFFYCLTQAEYRQYATELEAIMNREFSSTNVEDQPQSYNKLSNLRHFGVIARVDELLRTYPHLLSDYEREMLAL